MAKFIINIEDIEERFFEGQKLMGIAAPTIRDYQFCWMMNHYLGMHFKRVEDLASVPTAKSKKKTAAVDLFHSASSGNSDKIKSLYFPVFLHQIKDSEMVVTLYSNQNEGHRLIKELPMIDYLMLLPESKQISEWEKINLCSRIQGVQLIREIAINSLNSKSVLIF